MIKTMDIEILSTRCGDRATIIPSGYEGAMIVVFDDPAYNIHAKYLTKELHEKLVAEDKKWSIEQKRIYGHLS